MTTSGSPFSTEQPRPRVHHSMRWMITFADLISLILTFFVMLFAMSTPTPQGWSAISDSIVGRMQLGVEAKIVKPIAERTVLTQNLEKGSSLDYLESLFARELLKMPDSIREHIQLNLLEDRLIIAVSHPTLFDPNNVMLSESSSAILRTVGDLLRTLPNQIEVYGYAPLQHTSTKAFPSHWELSLARASAAAALLKQQGYLYPIRTYGKISAASSAAHMATAARGKDEKIAGSAHTNLVEFVVRDYGVQTK